MQQDPKKFNYHPNQFNNNNNNKKNIKKPRYEIYNIKWFFQFIINLKVHF